MNFTDEGVSGDWERTSHTKAPCPTNLQDEDLRPRSYSCKVSFLVLCSASEKDEEN